MGWRTRLKLLTERPSVNWLYIGSALPVYQVFWLKTIVQPGGLQALFKDQSELHYQKNYVIYYRQEYLPKRAHLFIEFLAQKLAKYL